MSVTINLPPAMEFARKCKDFGAFGVVPFRCEFV